MTGPPAWARALDLGGAVELSLNANRLSQITPVPTGGERTTETKTSAFQQRYTLRGTGDLVDPRAGTYTASVTFLQEQMDPEWFQSAIGGRSTEAIATDRRTNVYDYSLGVTLLPRQSPLSLFVQRVTRETDAKIPTAVGRRTVNTLSTLDWDVPARRLPRLHLNVSQNQSESDATLPGPNSRQRAGSLDTDGTWSATHIATRYQYADFEADSGATNVSQGAHVTAERPLTDTLRGRAYANYSTSASSIGAVTPGVSSYQENAGGLLLAYKSRAIRAPSLDGTMSYDYGETPRLGLPTLRRHLAQTNWNVRPEPRLDLFGGYRYFSFDVAPGLTTSHYLNGGASYRPIFNLTTGTTLAYGLTDTSGAASATNRFQSYAAFAQYLRTVQMLRLGAGYTGNYNQNETTGAASRDLLNTLSGSVENTNIDVIHLALATAVTEITREVGATKGSQQERRAQLNADSRYFRGLLRPHDQVLLFGSARISSVSGQFGAVGDTTAADTRATYLPWSWLSLTTGYLIERFPSGFLANRDSEFAEAQIVYARRRFLLTLSSRATEDRFEVVGVRRAIENRGTAVYHIGRLSLNLDYYMTRESREGARLESDSVFVRAVRTL